MKNGTYFLKDKISFSLDDVNVNVLWAKLVNGENESLLTRCTKHTFYEVEYALSGPIVMDLKYRGVLTVPQASFAIIPPDEFHQVTEENPGGARFIMAFSAEPKPGRVYPEPAFPAALRATPAARALLGLILKCPSDGFSRAVPERALFEAFTAELLAISSPAAGSAGARSAAPASETAKKAAAIIRECGGIGVSAESLAKRFGISPRHLCRVFTEQTGRNVRDCIGLEKQKRIETLLASTRLSLKETAAICGFSDEYAMNRFFRRRTGLNLSQFRLKDPSRPPSLQK